MEKTPTNFAKLTKPFIQVGIFGVKNNAIKTGNQMSKLGLPVNTFDFKIKEKTYWRVIAGPAISLENRQNMLNNNKISWIYRCVLCQQLNSSSVCYFLAFALGSQAYSFDTKARAAYVIDQTSGTVLLSKNADLPLPPASMSKLMTLYMTFEFIKSGKLGLDEKLPVSKNAANYTGSTMFLDPTDRVAVIDLIKGIIVLSGNDACAVLAEALSPDGTEAGFAKLMTQRAKQLGLKISTFKNSNGWPAAGHQMSVRDLGLLAERL